MLNNQHKPGGILWCDWTFNPITGCKHGCTYCYCNRLSKRFNKDFTKYEFKEKYLKDILYSTKLEDGDRIFVGSSGDMWGDWVEKGNIEKVLYTCMLKSNCKFLFLTKNPKRYSEFKLPNNCYKGITVDNNNRYINYMEQCKDEFYYDFISFEPLLENIKNDFYDMLFNEHTGCKWIIIGANSNKGEPKPPNEWADTMIEYARKYNIKIFVKDNYKYHSVIKELLG